jgi:CO/xanthine dehydrogenase Mo-binding subunit
LDVVTASFDSVRLLPGEHPGLDETARYERQGFNYPSGCHFCEVEIDIETCLTRIVNYSIVDDFGRIIDPLIVRGQVIGGVVQGFGQALLEETCYDDAGQLKTASLMDYYLPRADNLPPITVALYEDAQLKQILRVQKVVGRLARRARRRRSSTPLWMHSKNSI